MGNCVILFRMKFFNETIAVLSKHAYHIMTIQGMFTKRTCLEACSGGKVLKYRSKLQRGDDQLL